MNQHLRDLREARLDSDSVVTIGVFDGMHLGHQALVAELVARAQGTQRLAVALTFFPHPDKVLRNAEQRYYLTSPQERAELLLAHGIDLVITQPFDEATRRLPAADFVDLLLRHLRMRELRVGADFALGFQRQGDIDFLRAQGDARGFCVTTIDSVRTVGGVRIRSADLRDLVRSGDVAAARALLGRAYALRGEVVMGQQRGRTIGVPTANLQVWEEKIIPASGVYASWALVGEQRYMAAANIGTRPTFAGDSLSIEAHILDFDGDIYGETLALDFVQRLRAERKFAGFGELVAQIRADIAETRALLARQPPS